MKLMLLTGAFCSGAARKRPDRSLLGPRSSDADGCGQDAGEQCVRDRVIWSLCGSATVGDISMGTEGDLSVKNLGGLHY